MLYIVGTPIGNLNDLSYRQAQNLSQAEIILSEDTRSTGFLLQRVQELFGFTINPEQKVISYYKETEFQKLPQIIEWLEEGKEISLISQAGMPGISDPGHLLITTAAKRNMPFTVIPGPTAVISGLIASGFESKQLFFVSFFPKKNSELTKLLLKCKQIKEIMPDTVIAGYESPLRVNETLGIIATHFPESQICIAREMTKKFEEIVRGKAVDLMKREYKGEITLLIS